MISLGYYEDKMVEIESLDVPDRIIDFKTEPYFKVNLNTREVTVPADFRELAVYGDHNAETVWFAIDRWFDGVDLTTKVAGIQYENEIGDKALLKFDYKEIINDDGDADKTESDKPVIMLGWKIPYDVTKVLGQLTLSLRFYEVADGELKYNIGTSPFNVWITEGLLITDESQGLVPSADALSDLVQKIDDLYQNENLTVLDYNKITPGTLPSVNGVKVKGKLFTNFEEAQNATGNVGDSVELHYIPISYNDLEDKPTFNDVEFKGAIYSKDLGISYEELKERPAINGITLTSSTSSDDLGIRIDIDTTLDETSTNPVQNKVIAAQINALWEEMDGMTFIPLSISTFECEPKLAEKGSTVDDVHFIWTLGGNPIKLTINEHDMIIGTSEGDLKSLNLKENTEFTLYAEDKKGNNVSKTTELLFTNKVFHGVVEDKESYDGTFLDSLIGTLQTTREGNINVVANEEQYIYYASPTEYGDCVFTSGGFTGGFKKVATVSYINQFGIAADYDIWKSDYAGLGATNIVIS